MFFPSAAAYLIYADYSRTAAWKKQKEIVAEQRAIVAETKGNQ